MSWTALVPLKDGGNRKSRMAASLSEMERAALSDRMAVHVLETLAATPRLSRLVCLSRRQPDQPRVLWREDGGRGLNEELADYVRDNTAERLLVVHGDLPLLTPDDVATLIAEAEAHGAAIAPDRHGQGTNALALARARAVQFAFGPESLAAHRALIKPQPAIVRRDGLSIDVDTQQDLHLALERGADLGLTAPLSG